MTRRVLQFGDKFPRRHHRAAGEVQERIAAAKAWSRSIVRFVAQRGIRPRGRVPCRSCPSGGGPRRMREGRARPTVPENVERTKPTTAPLFPAPTRDPRGRIPDDAELAQAKDMLNRITMILPGESCRVGGSADGADGMPAGRRFPVESVPGSLPTTAAQTLASSAVGNVPLIQCAGPCPTDIVWSHLESSLVRWSPSWGLFTRNSVLMDEINRSSAKTSPRCWSAMLGTTIGGVNHRLPARSW